MGLGFATRSLGSEKTGNARTENGLLIRLEYLRNVDPQSPNSWGFEYWNVANIGTSYLLSAGYSRPRELSPFSIAIRAKAGWRIDENLTPSNPTAGGRNRGELIFPSIEGTYEIYKPFAFFLQASLFTWDFDERFRFTKSSYTTSFVGGLRIDLSGI